MTEPTEDELQEFAEKFPSRVKYTKVYNAGFADGRASRDAEIHQLHAEVERLTRLQDAVETAFGILAAKGRELAADFSAAAVACRAIGAFDAANANANEARAHELGYFSYLQRNGSYRTIAMYRGENGYEL